MELVVVAPVLNQIEAEILKGRLASEGIEAFIDSSNLVAARSSYSNRIEGLQVSVNKHDYALAMTIVAETMPNQRPANDENEHEIVAIADSVNWILERYLQSKHNQLKLVVFALGLATFALVSLYLSGKL